MERYTITFQTWNKVASIYQDNFMDLDLYNDTYDLFCNLIEKSNPKVLEIGCGPGNITNYILAKRPDFEIEAIDVAPNMIELAKVNVPKASFKVMDCRKIDKLVSKFDAIICGFCIPYLSNSDCEKLIFDSSELLNASGILYLSAIEGDYEYSGFETGSTGDQAYVYYHQAEKLQKMLEENNFELVELKRKNYLNSLNIETIHLIIIAKRK